MIGVGTRGGHVIRKTGTAAVVLAVLLAGSSAAQILTETPPQVRTLPEAEQVERELATARFRLGPVRLAPFLRLDDFGWTNNAFLSSDGEVDDVTASLSLGARLYLPVGRKVVFRGLVAPAYDWYDKAESLRGWGGTYSGEVLGLLNRLTVGGGAERTSRISATSSEIGRDVQNETTRGFARGEVKVLDRFSVYAGAERATTRIEDQSLATPGLSPVSLLDRTETAYRAGVRYAYSSALSVGAMVERVEARFEREAVFRDNDVRGTLLVVRYDRERFYLEGTAGIREGRPVRTSELYPEFRAGTYGYFASFFVTKRLELQVLGSRRPEAALFLDNPYYFETRNGARLRLALGRRLAVRALADIGSNRYVNPVIETETETIVVRRDATRQWGGGFDFRVSRAVSVGLTVTKQDFDSNIGFYDREVVRVTGGLSVTADFGREERR